MRARQFLPSMAAANDELAERQRIEGKSCCDIENIDDSDARVIEMVSINPR